jgi:hypothetical protein
LISVSAGEVGTTSKLDACGSVENLCVKRLHEKDLP